MTVLSVRKELKKSARKRTGEQLQKDFPKNCLHFQNHQGCVLDDYRIASFLVRDGKVYVYGEDSAVRNYSYIYDQLIDWMLEKFNGQKDEGPAEDIHSYLVEAGCPAQIMVSIGATRYTDWGEHNFLQSGDRTVILIYPESLYSQEDILKAVENGDLDNPAISVLSQTVVL